MQGMNNIRITQVLLSINSTGVCSRLFHSRSTEQQTDTGPALLIMEALPLYPAPHLTLWCVT